MRGAFGQEFIVPGGLEMIAAHAVLKGEAAGRSCVWE
jgi:hypothetical protein